MDTYWTSTIHEAGLTLNHVHDPESPVALIFEPRDHDGVRLGHGSVKAHGLDHAGGF
jgi:hypothetical protein